MNRLLLLLVLCLILGAGVGCRSAQSAYTEPDGELEQLRLENRRLLDELERARLREKELLGQSGTGEQGETIEVLPTDVFFESGSTALTTDGERRLRDVAARIRRDYPSRPLRVEGHTDSNPIGERLRAVFPSNWELSAGRAAAVVRHLVDVHGIDAKRFEVVGFGPYRPVASNASAEGRQQNRRVRIAVMP